MSNHDDNPEYEDEDGRPRAASGRDDEPEIEDDMFASDEEEPAEEDDVVFEDDEGFDEDERYAGDEADADDGDLSADDGGEPRFEDDDGDYDDGHEYEDDGDLESDGEIVLGRDDISDEVDELYEDTFVAPTREKAAAPAKRKKEGGRDGGLAALMIRYLGLGFAIAALCAIGAATFAGFYLNHLNQNLPDYEVLSEYAPPVTTRVYAGDGSLVAEFARERRLFVPIESMPDHVKYAFVSAEDKSFFTHDGLDFRGLIRAQISNIGNILRGRRLEGGSTITQQVAKNFLLSSEQKVERKLREMLIARKMERTFTKDHILELYLNEIYLGNRSYGVAAAALNYFDKSLDDLTIAEASYLAALTKGPSNYSPVDNEERAVSRRNWVIGRLAEDGRITEEEADEAKLQPLGAQLAPPLGARDWTMEYFAEEVRKQIVDLYGVEALYDGGLAVRTSVDPRLQKTAGKALRRWLTAYDRRHGWRGPVDRMEEIAEEWAEPFAEKLKAMRNSRAVSDDLTPWRPALVLTAGDSAATVGFEDGTQGTVPLAEVKWARDYVSANQEGEEIKAVSDVLARGDIVYVTAAAAPAPKPADPAEEIIPDDEASAEAVVEGAEVSYALRQVPAVNGGLIAIDPHTGRVLAMVGGFSFQLSEFNRAVQAERQPGSTFKPFVYSVALDSGYTPSSIVLDAPFVAPGVDSWYKPDNYVGGRYYGESTLRLGIEQSRNTMTARLAQDLGIGRIVDYIERFHLSDRLPRELAISLGAGETTLMRITAAYSIFVNGGKRVDPKLIDRIQDRTGKTIYKRDMRDCINCNARVWSGQSEPQLADAREQAMDPRTAFQITSILEGVVIRGTGSAVRRVSNGKPLAGKTGTTNDYKDAWFVGFSPDLAAGVYVGFDMPQTLGQGEAGGQVAAPIFADFMVDALKDEAGIPFRVPSGIRLVRVNAKTGRPATPGDSNVILEAFKTDDVIGAGPSGDDLYLDPLSAAPTASSSEEDLGGIY